MWHINEYIEQMLTNGAATERNKNVSKLIAHDIRLKITEKENESKKIRNEFNGHGRRRHHRSPDKHSCSAVIKVNRDAQ